MLLQVHQISPQMLRVKLPYNCNRPGTVTATLPMKRRAASPSFSCWHISLSFGELPFCFEIIYVVLYSK